MIILIVAVEIFIAMTLAWLYYLLKKNPGIVDVAWGLVIMLAGFSYLMTGAIQNRTLLTAIILLAWGARLSGFLWWTRIHRNKVDKRYLKISESWSVSKSLGFLANYQLQGLFIFIISLPFYFISKTNIALHWLDYLAALLAIVSISMEGLADWQLEQWKKNPEGKVCNRGLWSVSRHPNYFFEWLTWCAFFLFALSQPYGWLSIVSPLCLYLIMTQITGPITERGSLESKGDAYRQYQKTTPMFFPRPIQFFKSWD